MLNETVNAPNRFKAFMLTKKAKEVHTNPKNKIQRKSLVVIVKSDVSNSPLDIRMIDKKIKPANNS